MSRGLTEFTVIETIKGDLKPGNTVELPGLASLGGGSRKLADLTSTLAPLRAFEDPPPVQTGDRLIVFLRRSGALPEYNSRPDLPVETDGWQPAGDWGGFLTSAVWIQDAKVYAYLQTRNPGPTHLATYPVSEEKFRSRVSVVLSLRAAMDRAVATVDPVERTRQLVALMHSEHLTGGSFARASALRKLAAGGDVETNALLGLLSDETLLRWHYDIIQALAGKPLLPAQFTKFLTEETMYWSEACRSLKSGWWNDVINPKTEFLRNHYTRAYALLWAIRRSKLSGPVPEIEEFAIVWDRCPALDADREKDQIIQELRQVHAPAPR